MLDRTVHLLVCLLISLRVTAGDSGCIDSVPECEGWAKKHECVANPFYMRENCRKACGACGEIHLDSKQQLAGHATEEGTRKYATMLPSVSRHAAVGHFRKDTSMGSYLTPGQRVRSTPWLTLSSLGTGTYLGAADEPTDSAVTAAIIKAVYHGLNVIDTASNYRDGRGERSVGQALQALTGLPGFSREMLFVSTKAGFLETAALQRLLASGEVKDRDVQGGISCIAPACLKASLQHSLDALTLKTVDVLFLHNAVEMSSSGGDVSTFWERLKAAFEWLEGARRGGRVRAYGLATWTCFRVSSGDAGFLGLQKVVELAEQVGGTDHGFRYIQLPINAGMLEAVDKPWQTLRSGSETKSVTLLEAAAQLGVGVFASGPLGEGSLLSNENLTAKLDRSALLKLLPSPAVKLLQLTRSSPYLLAAIVGHKSKAHVEANLGLVGVKPMSSAAFRRARDEL